MMRTEKGRRKAAVVPTTRRRERTVRLTDEAAARLVEGHPWVYLDALRGRQLQATPGDAYDLVDSTGHFVARALYDPAGPVVLRVFSREPAAELNAAHLEACVQRAAGWRRDQLLPGPASALRVLNGDSEGVPAINVDRYANYLVLTAYSAVVERCLSDLCAALVAVWRPRGIYLQKRYLPATPDRPRPAAQLIFGETAESEVIVEEGRARFSVDVTAPLGTGLFIDMRDGRVAVAARSAGRRVLNCFSYTGAFSIVAALHGASEVVSVDSAARAHARARRNCSLNGLEGDERLEFVTGDTVATLARLQGKGRQFDLLVVDPPTFSSAKGRSFAAAKDYADITAAALRVAAPGAVLCAACNAAKLSWGDFLRAIGRGASDAGRGVWLTQRLGQSVDYPTLAGFQEGRYLKVALMTVG